MMYVYLFFFFFKQKTAYEMRISDWSSDVCSSDLRRSVSWNAVRPSSLDPRRHRRRIEAAVNHRYETHQVFRIFLVNRPMATRFMRGRISEHPVAAATHVYKALLLVALALRLSGLDSQKRFVTSQGGAIGRASWRARGCQAVK